MAYKEILDYIDNENRLLRPANMSNNLPGSGHGIYKFKNMKICVINLMTNVYMPNATMFSAANALKKFILKNVDFILVDIHGEYAAEKWLLAIYLMER